MKNLEKFWPDSKQINDCITPEAEADALSVLLAVHQPVEFKRREISNHLNSIDRKENEFLNEFLIPAEELETGTLVMPITGSSGIGKSHIIRWLDAHIRQIDKNDKIKRKIIRIPKNTSLKEIIFKILEDMKGHEYDEIRDLLNKAYDRLTLESARKLFLTYLELALTEKYIISNKKITDNTIAGGQPEDIDYDIVRHCRDDRVFLVFHDNQLKNHFLKSNVNHIVKRFIEGLEKDEEPISEFTFEDLSFPFTCRNQDAENYNNLLKQNGGQERYKVAKILNLVIDEALHRLFHQENATSIKDVFKKVRKQLLKDKVELILLIEDFAALAGIQGSLLDVVIENAIKDGKLELCIMRTALAVTEGYLKNKDTVISRAKYEWVIEDYPYNEEKAAFELIIELIASYLNAARLGVQKLEEYYKKLDGNWVNSTNHLNFIETIRDEIDDADMRILDQFGRSKRGYHLFPFNKMSIIQFAEQHLRQPNGINFNPRKIINNIIRATLKEFHSQFINKTFPEGPFPINEHLTANVEKEIFNRVPQVQQDLRNRYSNLFLYWGGKPIDIKSMQQLPSEVYEAFSLKPLFEKIDVDPVDPSELVGPVDTGDTVDKKGPDPKMVEIKQWTSVTDNWCSTNPLTQVDARTLRGYLAASIDEFIDWNKEFIVKKAPNRLGSVPIIDPQKIYLPYTVVSHNVKSIIIAEEDIFQNSESAANFRLDIMSVIKYNVYEQTWDFENPEEDMIRYLSFMERISKKVVDNIKSGFWGFSGNILKPIVQTLYLQSKLLNLRKADKSDKASMLFSLLSTAETIPERTSMNTGLQELQNECFYRRGELYDLLQRKVGIFQGNSLENMHAVDSIRVLECLDENYLEEYSIDIRGIEFNSNYRDFRIHIENLQLKLNQVLISTIRNILNSKNVIASYLGQGWNLDQVAKMLRQTFDHTRIEFPDAVYADLHDKINTFRNSNIEDVLGNVSVLEELEFVKNWIADGERNIALNRKGIGDAITVTNKIDAKSLLFTQEFLKKYECFLNSQETKIKTSMGEIGGELIQGTLKSIEKYLENIDTKVAELQEGR